MRISPTTLPDNFFRQTRYLRVLDISFGTRSKWDNEDNIELLAPVSLQHLVDLKTLHLLGRYMRNSEMSIICKLKNLEILELSFPISQTVLPEWIGELCNLRVLDLSECYHLELIPCNLISRLSKLEELYTPIHHNTNWSNAFLSDLRFLPCLTVFTGWFMTSRSPIPYWIEKLQDDLRRSRILGLVDLNELPMEVLKQLLPGVEHLEIRKEPTQGIINLFPQLDNSGFQNLRLLHLWSFESLECLIDMTRTASLSNSKVLPNLVELSLSRMQQLRKMCYGHPLNYLGNLRHARIMECPRLGNIVPDILSLAPELEELNISSCGMLKYVYNVETIRAHQLALIPCQLEEQELINEHGDAQLRTMILEAMLRSLISLSKVIISDCHALEEIFPLLQIENEKCDGKLTNLIELRLQGLPELKCVWKGPQLNYCLHKLKTLELYKCDKLSSLLTHTLAQSLSKLQYLSINNCRALETIISQDDQYDALGGLPSSTPQTSFQNIKRIWIESCDKLKSVLPMSFVAQGLPKLETMYIKNCPMLEDIFVDSQKNLAKSRDILMKNLTILELVDLPRLVPLSAFNWHLILASLARLKIAGTTFKHAADVLLAVEQDDASNEILPIGVGQSLSYLEVEPDSYFTNVEEVFHVEDAQLPVLTELRALKVGHMPNLKYLWKGPTEFINLCNLSEIEAHSCPEIKSLFTVGISQTLCSLTTLRVYNCKELKNIIEPGDCEAQYLNGRCFCELESLYVGNCEMLECVFPVFMVQNFPCLKSLKVEDCPKLENIFHADMASARRNSMNSEVIPLQQVYNCEELDSISDSIGEEESLSSFFKSSSSDEESLESIYEHSCEELLLETSFEPIAREEYCAPQSNLPHACLPYLKQIQVERCDKLKTLFPLSIAQHLPRLKKVHIKRASQLEQLFIEDREAYEGDKNIMLPKLKMIVLEELPYLISICPPDYVLSCQSFVQLPRVAIENCKMKVIYNLQQNHIAQYCQSVFPNAKTLGQLVNLSYLRHITLNDSKSFPKCIFTHSMVQTLQYLEIIEVFNCMELESIFDPAVEQKATASQQSSSSAVTCLPNLKALLVQGCDRLRTIFPLSVARRLPKLETVYVKRAHQLEEIFSEDLEEGHVECKSIELAKLKLVHLEEIPFLSQIWPAGYAFISPLFMLELKECPIREPEKLIYLPLVHFENFSVEFLFDLEQVPAQNGQLIPLNLQLLWLTNIRNLSCIWKGPTELINLSQLRHIILDDSGSLQMKSIFTRTTARTLCFLETIKIVNWKELENLIEPSHNEECVALHYINTSATCFPCLRSLQIEGCVRLKNIFPLSVAQCLPSLRIVYIKGAHQLEQVFYEDRVEVYLQSKLIEVPQLELLQLLELPCLSRILPAAYVLTWPPSAVLHLEGCAMVKPKLFPYMHSVHLENCNMEVMFDLEEEVLGHKKPVRVNIQNLWLNHLPNLALILKGPIELIDLSQLRFLRLDKSMALRNSLFTHTLAKTLYSLETLLILNCDNLESIIAPAANEEDSVVLRGASSFSTTFFSCLMCLQLEGCDRLRNVFPLSIAQSLPQLRTVIIIRAYQLEQIFYEDQNEKHVGSKQLIELPELLTLHLEQLPCLSSICPASYSLNCRPSSLHLKIIECCLLDIRKYFPKHPFSLEILNLPTLNMYARWAPPPPGYVTLNIAGAVNSTQGSAGAGGLLRDMRGYWIKGFSFHLDACTAIKAELQAIKEGLEMTSHSGYNKVILQTSSESVVDLLLGTSDELHPLHHLITICKNMLITYGNVEVRPVQPVEVRLVQHEANNPANWLAFFSFNLETIDTVHIFRSIPRGLRRLIYYDQEGIIYDPSPSYCK
ncbi:hypothetical protein BVRB_4g087960 [Beta vulgaris subsp. vulgaris]|nr:hypothetical protein BVRB_4g087960 [Beta vulgaris subsp. vulgaris]